MKKDYYDILGVPRNASQDDIKRAYRILAQQFHPDKENGSEKRFKEINEAYRVLSGPSSKMDYDRQYDAGLPDEEEAPPPVATSAKKPTKRRNYWVGVITFLVAYSLVRLAMGGLSSPSTAIDTASTTDSSYTNNSLVLPSDSETQTAPLSNTSTQAPTISPSSQSSGTLPTVVGACDSTTITQVGTRLTDGTNGDPIPGSGSAINYADGGYQVSYNTEPSVQDWQVGDPIDLCFVSAPTDCPAGDDRGIVYQATNKRTGETLTAQNSEHSCGGA